MLNKSPFLSFFSLLLRRIFVSSTEKKTIRMNRITTYTKIYTLLLTAMIVFCGGSMSAQGWEIYFGGLNQPLNYDDFGESVINLADGGYLVVGGSESFGDDNDIDIYAVRIDPDGEEIWSQTYDAGWQEYAYKVKETSVGNFIIAGFIRNNPGDQPDAYFLELDADGNLLWDNQFGGAGFDAAYDVAEAEGGGYVFAGQKASETDGNAADFLLIKTDAAGNAEWSQEWGGTGEDIARSVIALPDGYAAFGHDEDTENGSNEAWLIRTDLNGEMLWEEKYSFEQNNFGYDLLQTQDGFFALTGFQVSPGSSSDAFLVKVNSTDGAVEWQRTVGGDLTDEGYDLTETEAGELVVVGITELNLIDIDVMLAKYSSAGEQIWFREIGREGHTDVAKGADNSGKGGFIITGFNSLDPLLAFHDVTVIRTDGEGNIFSNYLEGKVFFDSDDNCVENADEPGLSEWLIIAEGTENTFYGSTDSTGAYSILADTGVYDIRILPKNDYWSPCTEVYENVQISTFYDTVQFNFPLQTAIDCPLLTTDVSAPAAQSCADITYTVSYCNDGTATAQNPYIEIFLDEEFTFNNADLPLSSQTGNMLTFDLPEDLAVGQCGEFTLSVAADCGSTDLTTYLVAAHIYPDDICTPPSPEWDMSSIAVSGVCEDEEVKFNITNVSDNNMTAAQDFVIIEDHVMLSIDDFDLDAGETIDINFPATGATYRIIAEQSPGHPGNSYPTVAVEGCATDGQAISTGFVTSFPEDEADAFVSVDVQQIGNNAPFRVFPAGYPSFTGDSLLVSAGTQLQYHLRFANTTAETINRLVIRDTLDTEVFDLATLAAGAGSHDFTTEIYEGGIVKFVFTEMNLAGGAEGFVQFKINHLPGLPTGTRFANNAEIFLGYEAPTRTEEVVLYIGGEEVRDFVTIDLIDGTTEVLLPGAKISAFPNPFTESVTIEIKNAKLNGVSQLNIYDASGRLQLFRDFRGNQVQITSENLPFGTLFFSIENGGRTAATGSLIVR